MAAKKTSKRNAWTPADLNLLKQHAGKLSVADMAKKLKRSESAIRFKASMTKTSLAARAPAKKK